VLELCDVSRAFGDTVALEGVSFEVPAGELVGLVGPNGAGKTTAMRITIGVLEADAGVVRWNGSAVDAAVRRRFGYMPEERGLYAKMPIVEQLAFFAALAGVPPPQARAAARRWIDRLGLAGRAADPVERLSLGNQQRVQLAAALAHDPALAVLDEPFSGLDLEGVDQLVDVLEVERARGMAVVFSSHQLDLVERLCRRVVIVAGGRVVAAGEVAALRAAHAGRRVRIALDGAAERWWSTLPGVRCLAVDDEGALLALSPSVDTQQLLHEAQRAGRLRHFSDAHATLAEIFRDAVRSPGAS
jgi:ABC-2 type transport system ATP-binding protein